MADDTLLTHAIDWIERGRVPDVLIRAGIRHLLRRRLKLESTGDCEQHAEQFHEFVTACTQGPIAVHTDLANEQHYEVPAAFYQPVLGRHLKYSCCHWSADTTTLDTAEAAALRISCERAQLSDGQDILELGCGWGSLSLWMAEHYPGSRITSVSNSSSQRHFILARARERGLHNLEVVTADMNDFATDASYDRVVSIEMFEHMRNYQELLRRVSTWLRPEGLLFVHIFCHRDTPYLFDTQGASNWMGRYFFSGGTMPSDDLYSHFQRDMQLIRQWRWNGRHYERTSNAWLQRLDAAKGTVMPVLTSTYGETEARRWFMRWRLFFMSCAELFGFNYGNEWWVAHYLFQKH